MFFSRYGATNSEVHSQENNTNSFETDPFSTTVSIYSGMCIGASVTKISADLIGGCINPISPLLCFLLVAIPTTSTTFFGLPKARDFLFEKIDSYHQKDEGASIQPPIHNATPVPLFMGK